jgi:fatty acid desaturase
MHTEVVLPTKYQELANYRDSLQKVSKFLPHFLHDHIQQVITNATSIAYPGQCQSTETLMIKPLLEDIFLLLTGVALSFLSACEMYQYPYAFIGLLIGYGVATRGICSLILVCAHYLTHGLGTGNKVTDDMIGNIISIVTITSPFPIYKAGHLNHHREAPNLNDFDAQQILEWGFLPGKPLEEYWRLILSPIEHFKMARSRIQGQFMQASNGMNPSSTYKIAVLMYWGVCLGLASCLGHLPEVLIAVIPPIIIGLQIGVIIEWVPRHQWFVNEGCETVNKALFLYPSNEPFLCRKLLVDLIVRGVFLSGDLPLHAYHHHVITRKWINSTQEVQRLEEKASESGKNGQFEYSAGYENSLKILFGHLSNLPKDSIFPSV